jgi:hypothetical protein
VEVQLGLRHGLDEAAAGLDLEVVRRRRHRPMLRFPGFRRSHPARANP